MQQSMCDPAISGMDYLIDFQFIKAFTCVYADPAGFLVVGLLVWAGVSIAIYNRQGSVIIPTLLLMLTAGSTMTMMASPAITIAGILVLVSAPGVIAYAVWRHSR